MRHDAQIAWEAITPPTANLAEVPVYDERDGSLYWIDVFGQTLHRTDWSTRQTQTWFLPSAVGSYALREQSQSVIVALEDGIYLLDLRTSNLALLFAAPFDTAHERFNDGRCDPQGRFWVGTIRLPGSEQPNGRGFFYRLADGALSAQIDGVTAANGIAFSPNGDTIYLADAVNSRLLAYNFDGKTGTVREKRVFATLDSKLIPDGAAVDTEGRYWIAMFGAGEVHRFTPEGRCDRVLSLPVTTPTMCAFGGPNRSTLIVATARFSLTKQQLADQPLAGAILIADVGAVGLPEPRSKFEFPTPGNVSGPSFKVRPACLED